MGKRSYIHALAPGCPYETMYETGVRDIKGWRAKGAAVNPPLMPPLDEPTKMAAWWSKVMAVRVPEKILKHSRGAGEMGGVVPEVESIAATVARSLGVGEEFGVSKNDRTPIEAKGFTPAINRLRHAEAVAGEIYNAIVAASQKVPEGQSRAALRDEAERARRSWDALGEQLRRYETAAEKIMMASGKMWDADEVVTSLTSIHAAIAQGVRGLWRRVKPRMAGCADSVAEDALWESEVERLFAGLRANKFTRAPEISDAAETEANG